MNDTPLYVQIRGVRLGHSESVGSREAGCAGVSTAPGTDPDVLHAPVDERRGGGNEQPVVGAMERAPASRMAAFAGWSKV